MRILQIHNLYREPGGEDVVVANEAALLREAGHQVVEHRARNPATTAATASRLAASSWNRRRARRLARVIEEDRPDVAHVHNTWFSLTASVVGELRRQRIPVVMTLHNYRLVCANAQLFRNGAPCTLCVGTHPWHGVRHACYRGSRLASAAAARAIAVANRRGVWSDDVDLFLVLTGFARDLFAEAGLPAAKMRIKPNFVPDPGPRRIPPSASNLVLIVSRLSFEKGVDLALEAWAEAAPDGLQLQVVGDGPLRGDLEARGVPGVTFRGQLPQAEVSALMLEGRALLFPSRLHEGQPMAVTEAFAAGLPVVAADQGAMAETLTDVQGGLVPAGDAQAWKYAVAALTTRDLDGAGEAGRELFENHYTAAASLRCLLDAYHEARSKQQPLPGPDGHSA